MSKKEEKKQETINNENENKPTDLEAELNSLKLDFEALATENVAILAEMEQKDQQIDKLQKTVNRLQSSADNSDKFRDQLVALKADFDSFRRRQRGEVLENQQEGQRAVLISILPILDTFALAKSHLDPEHMKAFEMVEVQFKKTLAEFGVVEVDPLLKDFDVSTMNALMSLPTEPEKVGKVIEVYKKGYIIGDKVLRYAEVIVGEEKANNS